MTPRKILALGARAAGAATAVLGALHFGLDGLAGVLVPLQPALAARTGTAMELWALVVAIAFSSASLLQPAAARLAAKWGDTPTAVTGVILAIIGYGLLPAAPTLESVIAAVVIGGVGSALFHPAAGALVVRAAPRGKESLPLAAFSAVGTAGAAVIPISVVLTLDELGPLATAPTGVMMLIAVVVVIALLRRVPDRSHKTLPSTQPPPTRNRFVVISVLAGAMIVLAGTTVNATTPLLIAADRGTADPLLGVAAAGYSAAGAIGGILLALLARRIGVRRVLLWAVSVGVIAGLTIPHVPAIAAAMLVIPAGAGLSGSLPLLVVMARRPEETTAGGAVARILGLSAGLGGASYAVAAPVQGVIGAGSALTVVVAVAGAAALVLSWRLCRSVDPSDCHDAMPVAIATCACHSAACSDDLLLQGTTPAAADSAPGAVVACPVMAGSTANTITAEAQGLYRDHRGQRYWFCCPACAPLFDADPDKYAAVTATNPTITHPEEKP